MSTIIDVFISLPLFEQIAFCGRGETIRLPALDFTQEYSRPPIPEFALSSGTLDGLALRLRCRPATKTLRSRTGKDGTPND